MTLDAVAVDAHVAAERARRDRFWSELTRSRQKWQLYREEPGFFAAHAHLLAAHGPDVVDALQDHAVVLVKPEAWIAGLVPTISGFLARNGFEPVASFRCELPPIVSREIWRYQWNIAPVERIEVSELILSLGPAYGFLLRDTRPSTDAPSSVRLARMKGPAKPERQRPGDLRYELGAPNRIVSFAHIPDEPADIVRDLSLLLGRRQMAAFLARACDRSAPVLDVTPSQFGDVSRIDDSVRVTVDEDGPLDSLLDRVARLQAAFPGCRRPDGSYAIPRALWQRLLAVCADVSALPTIGAKRVEPVADMR